jgi:hypothetical protein
MRIASGTPEHSVVPRRFKRLEHLSHLALNLPDPIWHHLKCDYTRVRDGAPLGRKVAPKVTIEVTCHLRDFIRTVIIVGILFGGSRPRRKLCGIL